MVSRLPLLNDWLPSKRFVSFSCTCFHWNCVIFFQLWGLAKKITVVMSQGIGKLIKEKHWKGIEVQVEVHNTVFQVGFFAELAWFLSSAAGFLFLFSQSRVWYKTTKCEATERDILRQLDQVGVVQITFQSPLLLWDFGEWHRQLFLHV